MLAKGNRGAQVRDACAEHGGFYLGSIGGPAARLAQDCIRKVEVLEYPELGMEAIWRIEVEDFPAFIVIDDKGNDFFKELNLGLRADSRARRAQPRSAPRLSISAIAPMMMMTAAVVAQAAGNLGAGGIADHAARHEADGTADQRPGARAHQAVDQPAIGAREGGRNHQTQRRRED